MLLSVVPFVFNTSGLLQAQQEITVTDSLFENGHIVETTGKEHIPSLGTKLPMWSVIPFAGILLSIALFPLLAPRFWHHNFGKISAFWALIFAIPFVLAYGEAAFVEILHIYIADYIPFIILLWALFTAGGGIFVKGTPVGTPFNNLIALLIGTLIASWIGTTGAAMVMIRPVLRMNRYRKSKIHIIIFFIFLVANIGGSLTPLGDPPLFLGFLHHVPFFWTFNLFTEMAFLAGILLLLFFLLDTFYFRLEGWHRKEHLKPYYYQIPEELTEEKILINHDLHKKGEKVEIPVKAKISIQGLHNLIFLAGIMGGVLFSGLVHIGEFTIMGIHVTIQSMIRDVFLIIMGILSLKTTAWSIREGNEFTWFPIKEVAILFAGIFMTIVPALSMLRAGSEGALHFIIDSVNKPWHYFWITGSLSSFLDNAPTYLTFLSTALGQFYPGIPEIEAVHLLIEEHELYLEAISTGAVFFGAMTYIGNAPNFMVKSIAEEQKNKMPSFFGYMIYSIIFLIPIFLLITWIFF
ncbi:MAG: sodium:proton antiporter [Calditrichaeota bacterium]|nr:sodium:proton antiporter [Calditrichota bacterium]RQW04348.1 MAG: sodium:proton antiporter [Calditrichota bacterium]